MAEVRMTVLPRPLRCCHCAEPILLDEAYVDGNPAHPELEEMRHVRDCERRVPRGPISDGTLPCPVTHEGIPCTKQIPKGWHENEGHSGGHWFQQHVLAEAMRSGHYDAVAALSGEPFTIHAPADCPGPTCPQSHWKLKQ